MERMLLYSLWLAILASCTMSNSSNHTNDKSQKVKTNEVLQEFTNAWIDKDGVVAVAEGLDGGEPCIVVYITDRAFQAKHEMPERFKGSKVVIRETTSIDAQNETLE